MDLGFLQDWFTLEKIMDLIKEYRALGPVPGVLLPMLEAFLPFLPLFIFVMANASAFGLWFGFLFSWIGACTGALIVFLLVRKYGQRRLLRFLQRHPKVQRGMNWVERHGFGPLFVLLCFPFTPSALVNIVAGMSKISTAQYMLAVFAGKMVMIFTISFVGYDIQSLITKPARTALVGLLIFVLWYVGKRIEVKMNSSIEKEHNG
ncbi:TVP38/TMEM64 family protein [Mesobacillus zeae]|uniref:TVP38/TMEM64 family membrane protein n=1 Tax=Mesobacillus zeae TaxID=1917180 RepID=A0A398B3W4_9BACI|nr:TVP38/TMEM64 family protein [Mesobacillus zeae]RID84595.1 TVP38/TMEM64 family protein [Mesobacillus zeae]